MKARQIEIRKQANLSADRHTQLIGDWAEHRIGFINGAKWADVHPKVDINDVCRSYEEWHKSRMQELFTKVAAHPHWISVEDELPKEDGQYLGCVKGKTQDIVSYLSGRWLLCNRFDITKVITHWMPLPAPPKKGGKE